MWAIVLPDDTESGPRSSAGASAGASAASAACRVHKRSVSASASAKAAARAKPKAKAKASPSKPTFDHKPWLPGPLPTGPIGYASDCSGLDAGAFALGRITAFRHHFASEVDPTYKMILTATHPNINTVFDDMTVRNPQQLDVFVDRVTIYTAGFPCPIYSNQGNRQGMDDPSGVALAIGKLIPDLFILENVPDFATNKKFKQHFDVAMRTLYECAGGIYNIHWRILNSRDFGVPALRQRLYIVGIRRDRQRAEWTWPVASQKVSLTSILDQDSPTDAQRLAFLCGLAPYRLRNLVAGLEKIKNTHPYADMEKEPWVIDIGKGKSYATSVYRDELPTITKTRAKELHWFITNRGGLIREHELLRCQGFDPSTIIVPPRVNRSRLREMAGNAVTVNVMEALFWCSLRALGRDR